LDEEEKDGFLLFFNSILFSLFFRIKIQQDDKTLSLFSMRIFRFAFFCSACCAFVPYHWRQTIKTYRKKAFLSRHSSYILWFTQRVKEKEKTSRVVLFFSFLSFSSFSFFYNITTERLYTTSTCREIERAVCQQDHPMAAVFRHRVIR